MKRTIYIIGTSHSYQHLGKEFSDHAHRSFGELVKFIVATRQVALISEESNKEYVEENGIRLSALQLISEEINVAHIFTEATREYRNANGMQQENAIRMSGYINKLPEEIIETQIQQSYRARERYWLSQIVNIDQWPVLHVCGANHSVEFCNLVNREGIYVVLLHEDWSN
jgi:hypothetical protein